MQWGYINNNANNFYTLQQSGLSIYNHPLYPLGIAFSSLLVRNIELGATLLSFFSNILTVYILYRISSRWLNQVWALGVMAVCASATWEIAVSAYAESFYMFILVSSVYCLMRFYEVKKIYLLISASVLLGCAYLTKPEGIIFFPLALLYIALSPLALCNLNIKTRVFRLIIFAASFIITVLPYSLYLKVATGHWGSSKFVYNLVVAKRLENMDFRQAYWQMNKEGTDTVLSQQVFRENILSLVRPNWAHLIKRGTVNSWHILIILLVQSFALSSNYLKLASILFLSIIFFGLIIIIKSRKGGHMMVWIILFFVFQLIPVSIMIFLHRPFVPLVPVVAVVFLYSLKKIFDYLKELRIRHPISEAVVLVILFWLLYTLLFNFSGKLGQLKAYEPYKEVGLWLSQRVASSNIIMARDPQVPYYAKSQHCILPEGGVQEILKYARLKHANYMVLVNSQQCWDYPGVYLLRKFNYPGKLIDVYVLR
jgi:hypothetical protein